MNNLQVTARYRIHEGRLDEFKKVAEECLSITSQKDQHTLQYDWYFNEDQTECVLRETYPDSNALLTHIGNIGELFAKIMSLGDFSAEVYGKPSEELMKAVAGLNVKFYYYYQGLETVSAEAGQSR